MKELEQLDQEIKKTKEILEESRLNYEKNPEDYSARLLLLSTENHLMDLLRRRDSLRS
jgi:hypothetical protein